MSGSNVIPLKDLKDAVNTFYSLTLEKLFESWSWLLDVSGWAYL